MSYFGIGLGLGGPPSIIRGPHIPYRKAPFSPEALDYFARLAEVDAHLPAYNAANAYLIDALRAAGTAFWADAGTITVSAGKGWGDGGAGFLVPVREGMDVGTNVGLIESDYDVKLGWKGRGGEYVISNRNNNADPRNDQSIGVFLSVLDTGVNAGIIAARNPNFNGSSTIQSSYSIDSELYVSRRSSTGARKEVIASHAPGYKGVVRTASGNWSYRTGAATVDHTDSSNAPIDAIITVGAFTDTDDSPNNFSRSRFLAYHIGRGIGFDLEVMDAILTEFKNRVADV
jgi:hypothetical protein